MSEPFNKQGVPKEALIAIGGLIFLTLALVVFNKFTRQENLYVVVENDKSQMLYRDLFFKDLQGGLLHVYDANKNHKILVIQPGTENFIRGVLRGLVRERKSHKFGDEAPFRLAKASDGQYILKDLATNREIHLNAFGHTNVSSFAKLLYSTQS